MSLVLLLVGCPGPQPSACCDPAVDSGVEPEDAFVAVLPEGATAEWQCEGDVRGYDEDDPAFTEETEAWGLGDVRGVVYIAPDLDGDGYADLIASESPSNVRDDLDAGTLYHHILYNREVDGRRTFVDGTEESGLLTNKDGGQGTSHDWYIASDVDHDFDLDVYAGRYHDGGDTDATGDRNSLYLNDGSGHFSLATESGLEMEDTYPSAGAAFTDVDGDGNVDLWLVGWYEDYGGSYDSAQPQLYMGRGDGTFENVTEDSGLELKSSNDPVKSLERGRRRAGFGATACDLTGDGLAELIHTSYGRAWNLLWTWEDGDWKEYGEAAQVDMDGNLDFTDNLWYACYCESHSCDPAPSVSCGGAFPDDYWTPGYDDQPARLGGNSFTTMCGDLDNDGDNDLVHTEIHHKWAGDSSDSTQILWNDGAGFFERSDNEVTGLARKRSENRDWNEGDLYGAFFDYDNDGWKDILLIETDYEDDQMWAWHNEGDGTFVEVAKETGLDQEWPNGAAIADFDRDGDLDLVDGSSNARSGSPWDAHYAHFYENGLGGRSLRVSGLPVGTRVEVETGGTTQTYEVSGGYGHWGMFHDQALTIGLGEHCAVDDLAITPPGGGTTRTGPVSEN